MQFSKGHPQTVNSELVGITIDEIQTLVKRRHKFTLSSDRLMLSQLKVIEHTMHTLDTIERGLSKDMVNQLAIVCTAIRVLASHLRRICDTSNGVPSKDDPQQRISAENSVASSAALSPCNRLLMNNFKMSGWCPWQAEHILLHEEAPLAYFLSRLPRRQRDHENCINKCVAWNSYEGYQDTQHRQPGCRCQCLAVPLHEITSIIKQGRVPLIRLIRKERDIWQLKVFARERYICPLPVSAYST
jgi:hypothetical protein